MIEGKHDDVTVAAGADLSAMQYKVIAVAGTIAAEADTALGVLQNKPGNGQHASLAVAGNIKAYAGDTIAFGARVTVTTSGFMLTVASGDGNAVGKALVAAASGDLFNFYGNFATANTVHNQT